MRWVWVDRFDEFRSGESARAVKLVSMAEDHVHDQYPDFPMMPHSLILEGLAQTGGILVGEANDFKEKVVLAKFSRVLFNGCATPGDKLEYVVQLLDLKAEGAIVAGQVLCNGEPFAEAEIVYAHLDQAREDPVGAKNLVFTKDHLISLLRSADGGYRPEVALGKTDAADDGATNGTV